MELRQELLQLIQQVSRPAQKADWELVKDFMEGVFGDSVLPEWHGPDQFVLKLPSVALWRGPQEYTLDATAATGEECITCYFNKAVDACRNGGYLLIRQGRQKTRLVIDTETYEVTRLGR